MKYNEYNTAALNAVGGKTSGLTMTVATMQLGVCAVYAFIMWAVKINPARLFGLQMPEKQDVPKTTKADLIKSIPLAFFPVSSYVCVNLLSFWALRYVPASLGALEPLRLASRISLRSSAFMASSLALVMP